MIEEWNGGCFMEVFDMVYRNGWWLKMVGKMFFKYYWFFFFVYIWENIDFFVVIWIIICYLVCCGIVEVVLFSKFVLKILFDLRVVFMLENGGWDW